MKAMIVYVAVGVFVAFTIAISVIDAQSSRNLAEERRRKLDAIKRESLPLQWAITTVRGAGRRKIVVLSDPNCPFCRSLEKNLAKLDDITVHVLPYPVLGPASERQAKAVWCSKDRAKAWDDLMFRGIEPLVAPDCVTPIEEVLDFGWRIAARGTPTWFLESGERFTGTASDEQLKRMLDEASTAGSAPAGRS